METLIILGVALICGMVVLNKYPIIAITILAVIVIAYLPKMPLTPPRHSPPAQTWKWSDFWNKLPSITELQMPSINLGGILPGQIFGFKLMSTEGQPIILQGCPAVGTGLIMGGAAGYSPYSIPSTVCVEGCTFQFPPGTQYSTAQDENGNILYYHVGTAYSTEIKCNAI